MPKIVAQKEEWIALGFKLFADSGISGINVEKMAAKLKCNKSSFYWHFRSKDDFMDEMIRFWIQEDTQSIIDLTNTGTSPENKFTLLIEEVFKEDPAIDFIFYLKRYAQKRKEIQQIIDTTDARRMEFVEHLFQGLGMAEEEAKIKSALFYKYLIGYHEMNRYKKNDPDYVNIVKKDLRHFLPINL